MKICIIGSGYVGLVTGTCLANLGNDVICIDNDKSKISSLKRGIVPFFEPGLQEMVRKNMLAGRLFFDGSIKKGVLNATVIFIAVGTPSKENGEADLTYVENVAAKIAKEMKEYRLIVEKSTVPVETGEWVKHTIKINNRRKVKFDVASNPEFLREGSAIEDFMHPDRIVIGVETKRASDILTELYKPLGAHIVVTDIKSAELIKHASNSFLATKISFINAIANICERTGADIKKVAEGMGLDRRIGASFLNAGVGFGGSCFPKDLTAFIRITERLGYDFSLLKEVERINNFQKRLLIKKIEDNLWVLKGKTVGVLGISFKPNTDDIRCAPSIDIINALQNEGVRIKAYDPQAMKKAKSVLQDVCFCTDPYEASKKADCLVILTEWDEFKVLNFKRLKQLMKQPLIIDGRNIYEPKAMKRLGFKYICIGR